MSLYSLQPAFAAKIAELAAAINANGIHQSPKIPVAVPVAAAPDNKPTGLR